MSERLKTDSVCVAGDRHRRLPRYAGPSEIPNRRPPQVVEPPAGYGGRLARSVPRLPEVNDRTTWVLRAPEPREHQVADDPLGQELLVRLPLRLDGLPKLGDVAVGDRPALLVLRGARIEADLITAS